MGVDELVVTSMLMLWVLAGAEEHGEVKVVRETVRCE